MEGLLLNSLLYSNCMTCINKSQFSVCLKLCEFLSDSKKENKIQNIRISQTLSYKKGYFNTQQWKNVSGIRTFNKAFDTTFKQRRETDIL